VHPGSVIVLAACGRIGFQPGDAAVFDAELGAVKIDRHAGVTPSREAGAEALTPVCCGPEFRRGVQQLA